MTGSDSTSARQADAPARPTLTPREREVLALFAQGFTSRTIGERLWIHQYTAVNHMVSIQRKLGARNTTHAVVLALSHGLISVDGGGGER